MKELGVLWPRSLITLASIMVICVRDEGNNIRERRSEADGMCHPCLLTLSLACFCRIAIETFITIGRMIYARIFSS